MSSFDEDRFRATVKHKTDAEIRDAAKHFFNTSFNKDEAANTIADVLREEKRGRGARDLFGGDVCYDGITVRTGMFPKLEIREPDPEPEPEPPRKKYPEYLDEDEDEDDDDD